MPTYTPNYGIPKPLVNDPQDEDLWGDYLNDGMDIIDAAIASVSGGSGGVPSGSVMDYAGATAPAGWLLCFGQAISRTTYAPLFTAIGTVYGAGDGSTTFNLPDCRGRVSAGKDDMGGTSANRLTGLSGGVNGDTLGGTGGAESHTLTEAQLAGHTHAGSTAGAGNHTHFTLSSLAPNIGFPNNNVSATNSPTYTNQTGSYTLVSRSDNPTADIGITGGTGAHTHTVTVASSGSNEAHNNVQPTIIFNKIIKE
jgi:microcystin-dependent protein